MNISDFKTIVEGRSPKAIQNRLVTLEEAQAVIHNYERLTEPYRSKFLSMPVTNIIEFALIEKPKNTNGGGFKNYFKTVEHVEEPEIHKRAPSRPLLTESDIPDTPPEVKPIVEATIIAREPEAPKRPKRKIENELPKVKSDPIKETFYEKLLERLEKVVTIVPEPNMFYEKLLERFDKLAETRTQPLSVTVETTENHVERLVEIEKSMLVTLNIMTERVEKSANTATNAQYNLSEMLEAQREMIHHLSESQVSIMETQSNIVQAISLLAEKIAIISQTPPTVNPIVNIPAPIVNLTTETGRRITTKLVERDENGLIAKVIESDSSDVV